MSILIYKHTYTHDIHIYTSIHEGEPLILSLDSSVTLAVVQLEVLNQLEKATGRTIADMFDWIVASGVGGFLMMAMVYCESVQ